jgi:phosphoribosylanthranilate isomerase
MGLSPGILFSEKRVVQIAGVRDEKEARMLLECGADLIGFPLQVGRPTDDADEKTVSSIMRGALHPAVGVVITYLGTAAAVESLCRSVGAAAVQLHGEISVDEARLLRQSAPDLWIVKTLVVRGKHAGRLAAEVDRFIPYVNAFITDTFHGETGRWGATGKTHDWSVSRRLVEYSARPVILAGGLDPSNVARAILEVRPAGVDAHTGVEDAQMRKDRDLVKRFIAEARRAFASL